MAAAWRRWRYRKRHSVAWQHEHRKGISIGMRDNSLINNHNRISGVAAKTAYRRGGAGAALSRSIV